MSIKQNNRSIKKIVKLLVDPTPEYLSLVRHGANMTPFTVVKADSLEVAMKDKVPYKISFDKSYFKDQETALKYLEDHGYDGFSVEEADNEIVVKSQLPEDSWPELSEVAANESGVKMFVGNIIEEEVKDGTSTKISDDPVADPESTAEPKPEPEKKKETEIVAEPETEIKQDENPVTEITKKFDEWMASYSNDTSVAGVLKAGADGLPPGFYEIANAMVTAIRNSVEQQRPGDIKKAANEFASLITTLVDTFGDTLIPQLMSADQQKWDNSLKETTEIPVADKPEELQKDNSSVDIVTPIPLASDTDLSKNAAAETKSDSSGLSELTAAINLLREENNKRDQETKSALASINSSVGGLQERVDKIENTSQSKKSVEVTDDVISDSPEVAAEKERKQKMDKRIRNNVLGMPRFK